MRPLTDGVCSQCESDTLERAKAACRDNAAALEHMGRYSDALVSGDVEAQQSAAAAVLRHLDIVYFNALAEELKKMAQVGVESSQSSFATVGRRVLRGLVGI